MRGQESADLLWVLAVKEQKAELILTEARGSVPSDTGPWSKVE